MLKSQSTKQKNPTNSASRSAEMLKSQAQSVVLQYSVTLKRIGFFVVQLNTQHTLVLQYER